jgi:hypothetical protein
VTTSPTYIKTHSRDSIPDTDLDVSTTVLVVADLDVSITNMEWKE